jgi:two-component system, NarL family, nitrate/nitrite response regulator NarL
MPSPSRQGAETPGSIGADSRRKAARCMLPNVRVVIASPVRLVREGLEVILARHDGIALLEAIDPDDRGIAAIACLRPDIVVVDLTGRDPLTRATALRQAVPAAKLIAFAIEEVNEQVFACAAAGFSGYVPRDAAADDVLRAVLDVANGCMHCAPHITAAIFGRLSQLLRDGSPAAIRTNFTSRESDVMALVERGSSNKEIARRLGISSATVKNHVHSILRKLQVSRRTEAIARLRNSRPR